MPAATSAISNTNISASPAPRPHCGFVAATTVAALMIAAASKNRVSPVITLAPRSLQVRRFHRPERLRALPDVLVKRKDGSALLSAFFPATTCAWPRNATSAARDVSEKRRNEKFLDVDAPAFGIRRASCDETPCSQQEWLRFCLCRVSFPGAPACPEQPKDLQNSAFAYVPAVILFWRACARRRQSPSAEFLIRVEHYITAFRPAGPRELRSSECVAAARLARSASFCSAA